MANTQHSVPKGPYRVRASSSIRLPAVREQARLTQMQLAGLAGVSERAVRNHESLVRHSNVWQATQTRLMRVCIEEIERLNRVIELTIPA